MPAQAGTHASFSKRFDSESQPPHNERRVQLAVRALDPAAVLLAEICVDPGLRRDDGVGEFIALTQKLIGISLEGSVG